MKQIRKGNKDSERKRKNNERTQMKIRHGKKVKIKDKTNENGKTWKVRGGGRRREKN